MLVFLEIVLSFPTVVFSLLLAVMVGYWLLAATGLVEIDALDGWLGADGGDFEGEPGGVTGPLMRLGLGGLPIMLILTVVFLLAWFICYFTDYLLLRHLPFALVRWGVGLAVLGGAFVAAVLLSAVVLRPLRRFFARLKPLPMRSFIGQSATIRSPTVTVTQGTASVEDGGAGLILQVRDPVPDRFKRGDRVVLIEYLADQNVYRIVAEHEFQGA